MKAKVLLSLILFLVLVIGTYVWLSHRMSLDINQLLAIDTKLIVEGSLIVLFLFVADAFRYISIINSLNKKISFSHALEAGIVNFFFAWTTPGAMLASPMTSFFLVKRKYPLDVSLLASFGKSAIGMLHLLLMTLCCLFFSQIHHYFDSKIYLPIYVGLFNCFVFFFLVTVLAFFPEKIKLLPKKIVNYILKLQPLFKNIGIIEGIKISLSQFVFFFGLISFISLLIYPFMKDPSWIFAITLSSIFLSLIYLSPTPGGVGFGELVGIPILGKFMPMNNALLVTVLIRLFLVYIPILVGGIYLVIYFLINFFNELGHKNT